MKFEELKRIVNQIKKYNLIEEFDDIEEFNDWVRELNDKQIHNFISLDVDPSIIKVPSGYLIDKDLLNTDDYQKRVIAMSKINVSSNFAYFFPNLCNPDFLNSKYYFEDMDAISKLEDAKYILNIIDDENFMNSKYHKEDLDLIVNTKDASSGLRQNALAMVAYNKDSINSKYHKEDMKLIAASDVNALQMESAHPDRGINKLAVNPISLEDEYHLDNMEILSKSPVSKLYLFELMTTKKYINGENYREEVRALNAAESIHKAIAIYYHITNERDNTLNSNRAMDYKYMLRELGYSSSDTLGLFISRVLSVKGDENPKYIENLKLLNEVNDIYVPFYEMLLSNPMFFKSENYNYDLNVLLNTDNKEEFLSLYEFMSDANAINTSSHIKDLNYIRNAKEKEVRETLVALATNPLCLGSPYHEFDMEFVSKLDASQLEELLEQGLRYDLFYEEGIYDEDHVQNLKNYIDSREDYEDSLLAYLNNLESVLEDDAPTKEKEKVLSRIMNPNKRG